MSTGRAERASQIVDGSFAGALLVLGLLGLRTTYGDWRYLGAGVAGVLLGLVVAAVAERRQASLLVVAAVSVVVFLLFGSAIALRGALAAGVLPTRAGIQALLDGALQGWRELLTVLPPIGASGNVLAIPYLLGLSGAVLAFTTARRSRFAFLPVLPAIGVLVVSILFGGTEPAAVVLQGAVFAAVALGWTAIRSRARSPLGRATYRRRLSALALVAIAGAGAVLVGPQLPLAGSRERVVLRKYIDPPLDLRDYVSPLTTYRKYAVPEARSAARSGLGDRTLFTVEGLPPGALLRIATMDAYDGTVWNVAGSAGPDAADGSGSFERVGETITTEATGAPARVSVTIGALGGIWLPTAGVVTRAEFRGANAEYLTRTFRYNRATDSAVAGTLPVDNPVTLQPGDRYTLDVVLPPAGLATPQVDKAALASAGPGSIDLPQPARIPEAVKAKVTEVVGGAQGAFARVQALADEFGRGAYSNGTEGEIPSLAGHYAARLDRMVSDPQGLVGDAEQYAAVMALMTRHLGIPARVVMGVRPGADTAVSRAVKGTDVTAWVEVGLDGIGWVPVFPTPPSTAKKPQTIPRPQPITRVQEPPPVVVPPRVVADPLTAADDPTERKAAEKKESAAEQKRVDPRAPAPAEGPSPGLVGALGLLGLVLAAVGAVLALKWRRTYRRRRSGSTSTRIAGGWAEMVDVVLDAGANVPAVGTRREVATSIGREPVMLLARRADHAVFAPEEPSEQDVDAYWTDVATARAELLDSTSAWARVKHALSLRSLRGGRARRMR